MDILLINPHFTDRCSVGKNRSMRHVLNRIPPLGIGYIAAVLEKSGFKVEIIDCTMGMALEDELKKIKASPPAIVGVSAATPVIKSAENAAGKIRKIFPSALLVIGGPHVTALPEETLSRGCFDIGVMGEGEYPFLEMAEQLKRGDLDLKKIRGIVYRDKGSVEITGPREYNDDIDKIPFPARHLFPPLKNYAPTPASYVRLPVGVVMTSRGCPFKCAFCDRAVFGNRVRRRSAGNVIDEIEDLIYKHGAREIRFFDDTFTLDRDFVHDLCERMQEKKIRIPWTCLTSVHSVTPALLRKMKSAGCWQVLFGLESGDERMLKRLGKGNSLKQNRLAVSWARAAGIGVRGDFIVGTPGETSESLSNTLRFAKELPVDYAHFNKFVPYPGTEIYRNLTESGYKFDFYGPCSILDHSALVYVPESLDREEYRAFLNRAYREFYLRPGYIAKRLTGMKSVEQLLGHIRGFRAIYGL